MPRHNINPPPLKNIVIPKMLKPQPSSLFLLYFQQPINIRDISAQSQKQSEWYSTPDAWTAIFTGLLFVATAGLWIFTGLMWQATRDLSLRSIKRPWLFVSGSFEIFEKTWQDEFWCFVRYSVANHGEAPAIIEGVQCDFIQNPAEPALDVIRSNDLIVNPILGPSETRNDIQTNIPDKLIGVETLVHLEDGRSVHLPERDKPFLLRIKIQYRGTSVKHTKQQPCGRGILPSANLK